MHFYDADVSVGLEYELPVHQTVFLGITRVAEENVCFRSFVRKECGGYKAGETAGGDDLAAHVRVSYG